MSTTFFSALKVGSTIIPLFSMQGINWSWTYPEAKIALSPLRKWRRCGKPHKMLIHNFLENSAARFPDKVALIKDQNRVSYGQINADADGLGSFLVDRGVQKGDRVVILLENGYAYVVSYFGILKAGAVAVPISIDLKSGSLEQLLVELEPAALITSFRFEKWLQSIDQLVSPLKTIVIHQPKQKTENHGIAGVSFLHAIQHTPMPVNGKVDIQAEDLANIIYTSSSTGKPKGAMLSHGNIVANSLAICDSLHLSWQDIQMVVLPFSYVMGQSLLNTHVAVGGTTVINNRFAYAASVLAQMVAEKVTGFSGVPATYAYLLQRSPLKGYRDKLVDLRYCTQAGGHMARAHKEALREALPDHTQIYIMYGATEGSARISYLEPDQFANKIESIGKPLPGVHIAILDENGVEVAPGQIGELNVSGPNIMSGYWKDADTTAQVLGSHGYRTGDMGYQDPDGYLFLVGRRDDIIKVGGHRISVLEVEDFLLATELVSEAAVFGIEDELLGHGLKALVVPKDRAIDKKRILKACSAIMPKYKIPSALVTVRGIPKTANGKADRATCLKMIGPESIQGVKI